MSVLIFVYGTLKQGFPNFGINTGRRLAGSFRTVQSFPLYVVDLADELRAPWLMDMPGRGHPVLGQVFEVDDDALRAMDALEEVGLPCGYVRAEIELEAMGERRARLRAQAYLKPADQLHACVARDGPFAEYTLAHAAGYRLGAAR